MESSINLVGKMMCEECDAFLGKPHKDTCSKAGRLVENADATEKFTTVEHADAEEPLVGIDPDTAEMILKHLNIPDGDPDHDKLVALSDGLEKFVEGSRNV